MLLFLCCFSVMLFVQFFMLLFCNAFPCYFSVPIFCAIFLCCFLYYFLCCFFVMLFRAVFCAISILGLHYKLVHYFKKYIEARRGLSYQFPFLAFQIHLVGLYKNFCCTDSLFCSLAPLGRSIRKILLYRFPFLFPSAT